MLESEPNTSSWAAIAGIGLLAAASFVGCAANTKVEELSAEQVLQRQPVPTLRVEETSQYSDLNRSDQAFLQQTTRLEKALSVIRGHLTNNGWRGSDELRQTVYREFIATEKIVLERLRESSNSPEQQSLERLYESVHVAKELFSENGLGSNGMYLRESGTDGTMAHVYGLEAQLMLFRNRLTAP